jgi:diguanylate cyclase (GGDEF)-like protein
MVHPLLIPLRRESLHRSTQPGQAALPPNAFDIVIVDRTSHAQLDARSSFPKREGRSLQGSAVLIRPSVGLAIEQDEIKGFSRTISEIEWLLLILVLIYLVGGAPAGESRIAISMALCFFGAFVLSLHYVNFYRQESLIKLAIETVVMLIFITWVVSYAGKISSPLLNLYLLPIIASALILGKLITSLEMLVVALCFMGLHYDAHTRTLLSLQYWGELLALLAPVILVAYITTMLSADIRFAVDKIKRVSDTDELTGLYNMRAFTVVLSRHFKQALRYSHPLSVVMIDCDNLKQVNDLYGHESGNRLLQHVARCVRSELRGSDVLARYGGDEFIALLPETDTRGAREMGERIRHAIERSKLDVQGTDVVTTVSIGIAAYPQDGGSVELVMEKADKAMYQAKHGGRNRVIIAAERG